MRFRGATSIVAVCGYCKSTLVRQGAKLEDIGKQAELLEDHSPLRIGAAGKHRGVNFQVAGRIQYRYGAGLWNEWHVLFDDRRSAWLSDANREYTITYLAKPEAVPAFDALKPGQTLRLDGADYTVTNKENAEVIAGEGELPFKVLSGWRADVADLRGDGNRFATIDYSEEVPLVYTGERLPFDAFGFSGLRDPEAIGFTTGRALSFKCGGCGAPVEKHVATTEVVACGSCGTVTDVTKGVGEVVQKNELNLERFKPAIPLGTVGTWKGLKYEVVGCMRRGILVDGERYDWTEYLLHHVEHGYAWISEYDGHFSFIQNAAEIPKPVPGLSAKPRMRYLGRTFTHFQRATASVSWLAGEFYWRVKLGDETLVNDYVDPPLILSSETTGNEITWSLGEYVEPEALWKGFGLKGKPPARIGVAPNQPSPHAGKTLRYWMAFLVFLGVALLAQLFFVGVHKPSSSPAVPFTVNAGGTSRTVSPVFKLSGSDGRATVKTTSNVRDNWLALDIRLVDADSGRAYGISRQLGYRKVSGVVDGSSEDVAEITRVPSGRYSLAIDAKAGAVPVAQTVQGRVEVYRPPPGWSNFWIFTGFLFLWPLVAWMRARAFESARWSESDYAGGGESDEESDDSSDSSDDE